jgi:hypothetical protein
LNHVLSCNAVPLCTIPFCNLPFCNILLCTVSFCSILFSNVPLCTPRQRQNVFFVECNQTLVIFTIITHGRLQELSLSLETRLFPEHSMKTPFSLPFKVLSIGFSLPVKDLQMSIKKFKTSRRSCMRRGYRLYTYICCMLNHSKQSQNVDKKFCKLFFLDMYV